MHGNRQAAGAVWDQGEQLGGHGGDPDERMVTALGWKLRGGEVRSYGWV